jgi:hypothetical protein
MGIFSISGLMFRFRKVIFFAVTWLLISTCLVSAQEQLLKSTAAAEHYLTERGEVIIRFVKPANVSLGEIATFLSVDEFSHDTITAYANEAGFRQFLTLKITHEVLQPPSIHNDGFTPYRYELQNWPNGYPSYDEYLAIMEGFANDYPDLCRLTEFGTSINSRKLLALKISDNPGIHEGEPVVFYSSTMHGDETVGYVLMLRLIEHLLINYNTDEQVKHLVDNIEIWINPLSNPDGTFFLSDASVAGATRFNSNHVDLNRDFPKLDDVNWISGSRQPETTAMMNFMVGMGPTLAANFHGGSEVVNYPWDTWSRLHADDAWFRYISRCYADTAHAYGPYGYMTGENNGITNGYQWYQVLGGRQDYVNYMLHGREVTIELSTVKMPAESIVNDYWEYNKQSLLQYMGQALTGVTGEITDSVTLQPLRASISIENHDIDSSFVLSDASNGNYCRLTGTGNYSFIYTAPGYEAKRVPVDVTEGELTLLNVKLAPVMETTGLYPNPFSNLLNTYIAEPGDRLELEFIDMYGRKVKQITMPVQTSGRQEIAVNGLASGVYIVTIKYGNTTTRQVVIRNDF